MSITNKGQMAMTDAKIIDGKAFSEKLVTQVAAEVEAVSYTHLTLPTILLV